MLEIIKQVVVRSKSALTTDYVSGLASPVADTGNTEDTDQDLTTSGGGAALEWVARKFTASVSGKIASISMVLGKTGAPDGTIAAYVLTHSGSFPGYMLGGASDDVTATDLSADAAGASQDFLWSRNAPELVASTVYWVVLKTSGYTYADGVTEIRWRTDANGAVAASECAKCLISTTPFWTTMGTDVGADLTVTYESKLVPLGDANSLSVLVDFTKGSSAGMKAKIEYSHDMSNWFQQQEGTVSSGVYTYDAVEHEYDATGKFIIEDTDLNVKWARVSVKALTSATGASAGVTCLAGYR